MLSGRTLQRIRRAQTDQRLDGWFFKLCWGSFGQSTARQRAVLLPRLDRIAENLLIYVGGWQHGRFSSLSHVLLASKEAASAAASTSSSPLCGADPIGALKARELVVSSQLNAFQRKSSGDRGAAELVTLRSAWMGSRGETAAAGVAGCALRMLQYIPAKWHIHHAHVAEALTTKMQEGARVLTPLKLPETRLSRVRARSESSGSDAEATRTRSRLCGSMPSAPDAAVTTLTSTWGESRK